MPIRWTTVDDEAVSVQVCLSIAKFSRDTGENYGISQPE
jgi:hypothetical protein